MKKCVAICATLGALAWVGVAAAATPQGKLTGQASLTSPATSSSRSTRPPVLDGGTSYVGLENDRSGNCAGDTGEVSVSVPGAQMGFVDIACAHFVASSGCCSPGSPKMRIAYAIPGGFQVVRITDNGAAGDTTFRAAPTLAEARAWVNKGRIGGGFMGTPWNPASLTAGDYTVTAQQ